MKVLNKRPLTTHPDDHYLSVYLIELTHNPRDPYVTWIHNSYQGPPPAIGDEADSFSGMFQGHYFGDLVEAQKDFMHRR